MSADAFLLVSLSARQLARAAHRADRPALGIDLYADLDSHRLAQGWARVPGQTRAGVCSFNASKLLSTAEALSPGQRRHGLVYGAGFESRPDLLARLAERRPLFGNAPEVLARVNDPRAFFCLLDELGIAHPEVRFQPPMRPYGWLSKEAGGCGGLHVGQHFATAPGRYFQRRRPGRVHSLLFLADGRRALAIGCNRALPAPAEAPTPWAYAGAVRLPAAPDGLDAAWLQVAQDLTSVLGLRGLNGLDFLLDGQGRWELLELNARPTATVELWDQPPMPPLFDLHIAACQGSLPASLPTLGASLATAVAYAGQALRLPRDLVWPAWCSDLARPGSALAAGEPVCSLLAAGTGAEAAATRAVYLRQQILRRLDAGQAAGRARPLPRHAGQTEALACCP